VAKKGENLKLNAEISVQIKNVETIVRSLDQAFKNVAQVNILSEDNLKRAQQHIDKMTTAALKMLSELSGSLENLFKIKVEISEVGTESITKLKKIIEGAFNEALSKVRQEISNMIEGMASDFSKIKPVFDALFAQMALSFREQMGNSVKDFAEVAEAATESSRGKKKGSRSKKGEDKAENFDEFFVKLEEMSKRVSSLMGVLKSEFKSRMSDLGDAASAALSQIGNTLNDGEKVTSIALANEFALLQAEMIGLLEKARKDYGDIILKGGEGLTGDAEKKAKQITEQIQLLETIEMILGGHVRQQQQIFTIGKKIEATNSAIREQVKDISKSHTNMAEAMSGGQASAIVRPYEHIGQKIRETLKAIVTTSGSLGKDFEQNNNAIGVLMEKRRALMESEGFSNSATKIGQAALYKEEIDSLQEANGLIQVRIDWLAKEKKALDEKLLATKTASEELKTLERLNRVSSRTFESAMRRASELNSKFGATRREFMDLIKLARSAESRGGLISDKSVDRSVKVLRELELYRKNMFSQIKAVQQGEVEQIERLRQSFKEGTGEFAAILLDADPDENVQEILEARLQERIAQYRKVTADRVEQLSKGLNDVEALLARPETQMLKEQIEAAKDLKKNQAVINDLAQSSEILSTNYNKVTSATISSSTELRKQAEEVKNLDRQKENLIDKAGQLGAVLVHLGTEGEVAYKKYNKQGREAIEIQDQLAGKQASQFTIGQSGEEVRVSQERLLELADLLDKTEAQYTKNSQAISSITVRHNELNETLKRSQGTDQYTIEQQKKLRAEIATVVTELMKAEVGFRALEAAGITLSQSQIEAKNSTSKMIQELTGMKSEIDKSVKAFNDFDKSEQTLKKLENELQIIEKNLEGFSKASITSSEDLMKIVPAIEKNGKSLESMRDKLIKAREEAAIMSREGVKGADELYARYTQLLKATDRLSDASRSSTGQTVSPMPLEDIVRLGRELEKVDKDLFKFRNGITGIEGDLSRYTQQLKGTSQEKLEAANAILKMGSETASAARSIDKMIHTLEEVRRKTGQLSAEDEQKLKQLTQLRSRYSEVNHAIDQKRISLERIRKDVRDSTKGFADYTNQLGDAIIRNFRFAQSAAIIGSVVMGLRNAFRELIEESKAFARTLTVMRSDSMTLAQIYEELRETIRSTAIEFGQSTSDVLEVVKQFGSAGLSAEESMRGLQSAMKLVISTQANAEAVTRSIAGIYNVFGKDIAAVSGEAKVFSTIVDVMTSAYRNHQVELDEMTQGLKFAAATGRLAGFSFQEISAFLAVLNDNLIKSGTAGRGLQVVFAQLAAKREQLADALGFDLDPNLTVQEQFVDLLSHTNKLIGEGSISVENLDAQFRLFGLRGARSFATLAQNVDSVKATLVELQDEAEGTADQLASIVKAEVFHSWEVAKQALMEIGRDALEPMKDSLITLTELIRAFSDMLKDTGLGPFLTNIGYGIFIIGILASSMVGISRVFNGFFILFAKWTAGIRGLATSTTAYQVSVDRAAASMVRFKASAIGTSGAVVFLGKALSVIRVGLAAIGGPLGAVITGFMILMTLLWKNRDTLEKVDRNLGEITGKIRDLADTNKRLDTFADSFIKIQQQIRQTGIDATIAGQKIRDAFDQAGDSVISGALLAGRSNKDIVRDLDSISAAVGRITEARRKQIEQDRQSLEDQIVDELVTRVRVAAKELKGLNVGDIVNLNENFENLSADEIKIIKDFKEVYKNALIDIEERTGSLDEAHRRLVRGLRGVAQETEEVSNQQRSFFRILPARGWGQVAASTELASQALKEMSDTVSDFGFNIRQIDDLVDVSSSAGDRLFEMSEALAAPIPSGMFDKFLSDVKEVQTGASQVERSIQGVVNSLNQSIEEGVLTVPDSVHMSAIIDIEQSSLSSVVMKVSEQIGKDAIGPMTQVLTQNLRDMGVQTWDIVTASSGADVTFAKLLQRVIEGNSQVSEMADGVKVVSVNWAEVFEKLSAVGDAAGFTKDQMKEMVSSTGAIVTNTINTDSTQRLLVKNAALYVDSLRTAVKSQNQLNPLTAKMLELRAIEQKNSARQLTGERQLGAMRNNLIVLNRQLALQQSKAREESGEAAAEAERQVDEINKKIIEQSNIYKSALEDIEKQNMLHRENENEIDKNKRQAEKLNEIYRHTLSISEGDLAKQVHRLSLKRREIKDQVELLRRTDMLKGSEAERMDALNQIKQLKIDEIELLKETEEKWHSQNAIILDTLHIFEEIAAVGEDYVNQQFRISNHATNLLRVERDLVRVNKELSVLSKDELKTSEDRFRLESSKVELAAKFAKEYQALISIQKDLSSQLERVSSRFDDVIGKILGFSKRLSAELASSAQVLRGQLADLLTARGPDMDLAADISVAASFNKVDASRLRSALIFEGAEERAKAIEEILSRIDAGQFRAERVTDFSVRGYIEQYQEAVEQLATSFEKSRNIIAESIYSLRDAFELEIGKGDAKNFKVLDNIVGRLQSRIGQMADLGFEIMSDDQRVQLTRSLAEASNIEREILRVFDQVSTEDVSFQFDIVIGNQDQLNKVLEKFNDSARDLRDYLADVELNPNFIDQLDEVRGPRSREAEALFGQMVIQQTDGLDASLDEYLGRNSEFASSINSFVESLLPPIDDLATAVTVLSKESEFTVAVKGLIDILPTAILQLVKAIENIPIKKRAGGPISGYGGGDKVPALLERGEYVMPKEVVAARGVGFFDHLRKGGKLPGFMTGGSVLLPGGGERGSTVSAKVGSVILTINSDSLQKTLTQGGAQFLKKVAEGSELLKNSGKKLTVSVKYAQVAVAAAQKEIAKNLQREHDKTQKITTSPEYIKAQEQSGLIRTSSTEGSKVGESTKVTVNKANIIVEGTPELKGEVLDAIDPETKGRTDKANTGINLLVENIRKANSGITNFELDQEIGKKLLSLEKETMIIFDKISRRIKLFYNTVAKSVMGFLDGFKGTVKMLGGAISKTMDAIFQGTASNTEAVIQYRKQVESINEQYRGQISIIQEGLRRGASSYWDYINSIQDAERQRFEQLRENEQQLRDQIVKTGQIVGQVFNSQSQDLFSAISSNISAPFGGARTLNDEGEVQREASGIRGFFNLHDTTDQLESFYGSIFRLSQEAEDGRDAVHRLVFQMWDFTKITASFGLDLLELGAGLAMQGLQGLVGVLTDPEKANVFMDQFNNFIEEFPQMAPEFINGLLDNLDVIIDTFAKAFPEILQVLVDALPTVVEKLLGFLAEHLPGMIGQILEQIPGLIVKLIPIVIRALVVLLINLVIALANLIPGVNIGKVTMDKFHKGGMIGGDGEVPIMALSGEAVLSREAVAMLGGERTINEFNQGRNRFLEYQKMQKFHKGGIVGGTNMDKFSAAPTSSNISKSSNDTTNIYLGGITIKGDMDSKQAKQVSEELLNEIDKGLKKRKDDRSSRFDK